MFLYLLLDPKHATIAFRYLTRCQMISVHIDFMPRHIMMLYSMLIAHNKCYLCSAVPGFQERTCISHYSSGIDLVSTEILQYFHPPLILNRI